MVRFDPGEEKQTTHWFTIGEVPTRNREPAQVAVMRLDTDAGTGLAGVVVDDAENLSPEQARQLAALIVDAAQLLEN